MTSSRLVSAIPRARINFEAAATIRSRVARPLAVLGSSVIYQILGVLDPMVQRLHIFGNALVRTRVASKDRIGRGPPGKREAGDDFRTHHRHRRACHGAQYGVGALMVSSLKVGEDLSKRAPGAAAYAAVADMNLVYLSRDGDEAAFEQLVDRYYGLTLRVARTYVGSHALAEEVAQEAWIGIIKGLQRFEGRSSLKTWIMRIVMNIANNARARAIRESRSVPFSELSDDDGIDRTRFRGVEDPYPGHWTSPPRTWRVLPDEATSMRETLEVVRDVVEALPEKQRLVFTLRDIEGWDTADIAQALDVSDNNQRVLLHRARTKVRAALEG